MENKIEQVQGDEEIIEKLYSYLVATFPRLNFKVKIPLKELFPEPENRWLNSIWRYGHGDICTFRHGKLVALLEPGGHNHFSDEK